MDAAGLADGVDAQSGSRPPERRALDRVRAGVTLKMAGGRRPRGVMASRYEIDLSDDVDVVVIGQLGFVWRHSTSTLYVRVMHGRLRTCRLTGV